MERIKLTRDEKTVLLHVEKNGGKQPRNITPVMFQYSLSTLREKGLVSFRSDYEKVISAGITLKGVAYMERNPKLKNPVDWKGIVTIASVVMTAIATTLALFVACSVCK